MKINRVENFLNKQIDNLQKRWREFSHFQKIGILIVATITGFTTFIYSLYTGFIFWLLALFFVIIGTIMLLWSKEVEDVGLGFCGSLIFIFGCALWVFWKYLEI